MQFRLDVKESEKDVEALKKKVDAEKSKGTLTADVPSSVRKRKTASGAGMDKHDHDEKTYGKRLMAAAINRFSGAAGLHSNQLSATVAGAAGTAQSFLPKGAAKALGAAGTAAAAYGIVSQGAKILPEAFEAGKLLVPSVDGVDPSWFETVERTLQDLAMGFHKLENSVTSVYDAFKLTKDFSQAARRITGETPDTLYYAKQNYEVTKTQKNLQDKFDLWKAKEAPLNTANTFLDLMKRSLTR